MIGGIFVGNKVLGGLKPEKVFGMFEMLSSVPHGSGNTRAISDLCVSFAKEHGLRYVQDGLNNIVIYAPATAGREDEQTIVLQGHLDMVCAKDDDVEIDMATEPIRLFTDGKIVRAEGTTLGGDNCIAVAMALAVLDSPEISHPALECVFTVDEEVGMEGAAGIDASLITGRRFLNLDSDEEGVFTCGCAGGARVNCHVPICRCGLGDGYIGYTIRIDGLLGGHSGGEIQKGRGNSNVLMARMLYDLSEDLDIRVMSFEGGRFDNAITNDTSAVVYIPKADAVSFENQVAEYAGIYADEYKSSDPDVHITLDKLTGREPKTFGAPLDSDSTHRILYALWIAPYGVQEMSMDLKGLVETSLNPGITRLEKDMFEFSYLVRSSVASRKKMLVDKLNAIIISVGGTTDTHGEYPGWQFARVSPLRDHCAGIYKEMTGREPLIYATHGGLECGLFSDKLPGLDCISLGADLFDLHSPRERMVVESVARTWEFLKRILEEKIK